jgi:hypothetical protein
MHVLVVCVYIHACMCVCVRARVRTCMHTYVHVNLSILVPDRVLKSKIEESDRLPELTTNMLKLAKYWHRLNLFTKFSR